MFYLKIVVATLVACLLWTALIGYGALNGWFTDALAKPGDARGFMDAAVPFVEARNRGNAAFVLIEGGQIFDEHYFDIEQQVGVEPRINRDTVFATASSSKWITALAVMGLVERGLVELDAPVGRYLTRWQLPTGSYDPDTVTVRRVLSHTAGLTDGLGFGDYLAEETVPSVVESLSAPRSSSGDDVQIAVGAEPGTEFQYSGGGYLMLELLVEEVSGEPFDQHLRHTLFEPLSMTRSTYEWPGTLDNIATSYDVRGNVAPNYQYASKAATGFATSAADLARLVSALLGNSDALRPLRAETLAAMRTPEAHMFGLPVWGLGTILYAPTESGDFIFGHDGANEPALNASIRINPDNGDAFVMLSTGGETLASTLGFEWAFWQTGVPDFLGIQAVLAGIFNVFAAGWIVIVGIALLSVWRRRRSSRQA